LEVCTAHDRMLVGQAIFAELRSSQSSQDRMDCCCSHFRHILTHHVPVHPISAFRQAFRSSLQLCLPPVVASYFTLHSTTTNHSVTNDDAAAIQTLRIATASSPVAMVCCCLAACLRAYILSHKSHFRVRQQTMIVSKKLLATTHATDIGAFASAAYFF
jgi:hypothetical protein